MRRINGRYCVMVEIMIRATIEDLIHKCVRCVY